MNPNKFQWQISTKFIFPPLSMLILCIELTSAAVAQQLPDAIVSRVAIVRISKLIGRNPAKAKIVANSGT